MSYEIKCDGVDHVDVYLKIIYTLSIVLSDQCVYLY